MQTKHYPELRIPGRMDDLHGLAHPVNGLNVDRCALLHPASREEKLEFERSMRIPPGIRIAMVTRRKTAPEGRSYSKKVLSAVHVWNEVETNRKAEQRP